MEQRQFEKCWQRRGKRRSAKPEEQKWRDRERTLQGSSHDFKQLRTSRQEQFCTLNWLEEATIGGVFEKEDRSQDALWTLRCQNSWRITASRTGQLSSRASMPSINKETQIGWNSDGLRSNILAQIRASPRSQLIRVQGHYLEQGEQFSNYNSRPGVISSRRRENRRPVAAQHQWDTASKTKSWSKIPAKDTAWLMNQFWFEKIILSNWFCIKAFIK